MKYLSDIWDSPAVGLDIGPSSVRAVVLTKLFKRIRLARFGEESFSSPSETAIVGAVQKLFKDLKIRQKEVIIHATGKGIRHVVIRVPLQPASELSLLIQQQIAKQLPVSIDPSKLILSFHIIEQTDQGFQVLVSYCQMHALEEKINLIEKAGLIPLSIGSRTIDLIQSLAFSRKEFFDQPYAILTIRKDQTEFFITKNGSPIVHQDIDTVFNQQKNVDKNLPLLKDMIVKTLSEWQEQKETKIKKMIVTGDVTDDILEKDRFKQIIPSEIDIEAGYPLEGLLPSEQRLEPKYSLAAGLALKKYFPLLNTIDLLPDDRKNTLDKMKEKKTSLGIILGFGSMILILLLILTVIQSMMTNRLNDSEEELVLYQDQISVMEQAQNEQIQLQKTYQEIERLVTQRSNMAELLEEISRILPEEAWLQEFIYKPVEIQTSSQTTEITNQIRISGLAFNESAIAILISNLENSKYFQNIQLITTNRISGDEVFNRTKIINIPLIQFAIQVESRESTG